MDCKPTGRGLCTTRQNRIPPTRGVVRWSRCVRFAEGAYRFSLSTDDGLRLWVSDDLPVDEWSQGQSRSYEASLHVENGYHCVQLKYYDSSGPAGIQLNWERISQP